MPTPYGKYQLLRKIAEGGMAEVFLAKQGGESGFEKLVVIKRILPHLTDQPEFVRMFVNEARIAARLQHSNIAQIFDLGRVGSSFFIAMEYVHGEDVAQIARRSDRAGRSPLDLGLVARVVCDVCAGLHYAHHAVDAHGKPLGIVHRDVSPQNVMATYEGEVKIVDFGIAKATAIAGETQAGVMKGKYAYMSPEQCKGEKVDLRSDVFACGVILWELTAWRRLFKREADYLTMRAVVEEEPASVRASRPQAPEELDRVLARALAKRREDRYPTCEALAEDLEELGRRAGWDMSRRTLGRLVGELFADKLAAQQQSVVEARAESIEAFLMSVDEETKLDWMRPDGSHSDSRSDSVSLSASDAVGEVARPPTTPPPVPTDARTPRPRVTASVPVVPAPVAAPAAPRSRLGPWLGLGLAVAAALGLAVAWRLRSGRAPQDAELRAGPAQPAPAPAPAAPPDAGPPPLTGPGRLVLRGQEKVAVFLDGRKQGETPLTLEDLAPGRPHVITLIRRGYRDGRLEVPALAPGEERILEVELEPARRRPR